MKVPNLSLLPVLLLAASWLTGPLAAQESGEHAHHHHHQMTEAQFARLREAVDQYKTMSNDEIMQSMAEMPGNYHWYVSQADLRGKLGVLVLAHGAGERGDQVFKKSLEPLAAQLPLALGFGMSMMGSAHLQAAVAALDEAGAETIVVVPAALSRNASVYRQWDYIFGGRVEPAYLKTDPIRSDSRIVFASVMGSHPIVSEILADHAREISTDPANEVLIVVGHGPQTIADNQMELAVLRQHEARLRQATDFSQVRAINLQDDAPPHLRSANVANLRHWIQAAAVDRKEVILVGFLMSTRGIQYKFDTDLAGLTYRLNPKGISQHPRFVEWIEASVQAEAGPALASAAP